MSVGREAARLGHGGAVAEPQRVQVREAFLAIFGRHVRAHVDFGGALVGADAEQVHLDAELVEEILVIGAITLVAVDGHEAQRIEIDFVGRGGDVVALLQERGGVRHHLLARAAEILDGRGELRERGLPATRHVVEIEDDRGDARVFLGGLERVDEIPEQGLFLARCPAPFPAPGPPGCRRAARRSRPWARAPARTRPRCAESKYAGLRRQSRRSSAAPPGAGTCAARRGHARCRRRSGRSCRRSLAQEVRPSLRCARPCRTDHAGSTAWRDGRCRGA